MKLAIEGAEEWQLLTAVYPLFTSKLPCYDSDATDNEKLKNFRDFFQFEVSMVLSEIQGEYDLSDPVFEECLDALKSLLSLFESLLDERLLDDQPEKPQRVAHAKLQALQVQLNRAKEDKVDLVPLFGDRVQLSTKDEDCTRTLEIITNYNKTMRRLFKSTYDMPHEPRISPIMPRKRGPLYQARDFVHILYQSLVHQLANCPTPHNAKLHLMAYQALESPGTHIDLDMFLSTCSEPYGWQESKCVIDGGTSSLSTFRKRKVNDICALIRSSRSGRKLLRILVARNTLWDISDSREKPSNPRAHPTVSLRSLLEGGHFRSKDKDSFRVWRKDKKILAVILAHSLLQLCEGPWLQKTWNSESIFFLYDPDIQKLLDFYRPYISASLSTDISPGVECNEAQHKHPFLLAFGILLLEIECGNTIKPEKEDYDLDTGRPGVNTLYFAAERMLEELRDDMSYDYRYAIDSCLGCEGFLPNGTTFNNLNFRHAIYKHIVAPLEEDLYREFRDVSLDELDRLVTPKTLEFTQQLAPPHLSALSNTQMPFDLITWETSTPSHPEMSMLSGDQSTVISTTASPTAPSRSAHQARDCGTKLALFDDDEFVSDHKQSRRSDKFFKLLHSFHKTHIDPLLDDVKVVPKGRKERVRIAILDTGIDCDNEVIRAGRKRIKGTRSWIGDSNDITDTYDKGHGTHTTALLLNVAPGAEIYVAKISQDKYLEGTDHIANAINWATEECKADIITMSFGLSTRNHKIDKAISDSYSAGRILLAAASNEGGNDLRAYPANQRKVICVNCTDGKGNDSGLNPSPVVSDDNFSTLGVAVESSWKGVTLRKSGTSYAAPIAAGIAASFLDYARYKLEMTEEEWEWLYSCDGMREIFRLMSQKRCSYDYIAPWILWKEAASEAYVHERILERIRAR